jgi:hypothetical protein
MIDRGVFGGMEGLIKPVAGLMTAREVDRRDGREEMKD